MRIREILQIELWSKRTSRKILAGIGIVVAGLIVLCAAEEYWTTPGERRAARVALKQIDALQGTDSLSDEEFKIRHDAVNLAINSAELAAKTSKDELIVVDLIMCSMIAESARMNMMKQRSIQQGRFHPFGEGSRIGLSHQNFHG